MCYMCVDCAYNSRVYTESVYAICEQPYFYSFYSLTIENVYTSDSLLLTVTDYCLHYISKLILNSQLYMHLVLS